MWRIALSQIWSLGGGLMILQARQFLCTSTTNSLKYAKTQGLASPTLSITMGNDTFTLSRCIDSMPICRMQLEQTQLNQHIICASHHKIIFSTLFVNIRDSRRTSGHLLAWPQISSQILSSDKLIKAVNLIFSTQISNLVTSTWLSRPTRENSHFIWESIRTREVTISGFTFQSKTRATSATLHSVCSILQSAARCITKAWESPLNLRGQSGMLTVFVCRINRQGLTTQKRGDNDTSSSMRCHLLMTLREPMTLSTSRTVSLTPLVKCRTT